MVLSSLTVILASGFWLILLIGCLLFSLVAMKKRAQVEDLEQIVDTQRTHLQRLMKLASENAERVEGDQLAPNQENDAADKQTIIELTKELEALQAKAEQDLTEVRRQAALLQTELQTELQAELKAKQLELERAGVTASVSDTAESSDSFELSDSIELSDDTGEDVGERNIELEALNQQQAKALSTAEQELAKANKMLASSKAIAKSLRQENEILDRQLQALAETAEAGDADTMREIIVNFTEESRELLLTIQKLEVEQVDLKQQLVDTESSEKGTTGAVVGLKRKLAQSEQDLLDLQEEYDLFKAGKSAAR